MKQAHEVSAKWALPPKLGWASKVRLLYTAEKAKDFEKRARLEIADIRAILALRGLER